MGLFDFVMDIAGIGEGQKQAHKNRAFQWKALQAQLGYQKEFAQQGLRWRVEDAKAAGLHPLSALGAQGLPAYSPVSVDSGSGPVEAAIGRGIRSPFATKAERAAQLAALAESASRAAANDAEAGYYRAMEAKIRQEAVAVPSFPEVNISPEEIIGNSVPGFDEYASTAGTAKLVQPSVNMSRDGSGGGIVAGPANPSMREFHLPGGFPMMLPDATSLGEALEPISESMVLGYAIYKENVRYYGEGWRKEFLKRYGPNWVSSLLGLNKKNRFESFKEREKRLKREYKDRPARVRRDM